MSNNYLGLVILVSSIKRFVKFQIFVILLLSASFTRADPYSLESLSEYLTNLKFLKANFLQLNADGSEANACGNGTRCVASVLLSELKKQKVLIETISGIVSAYFNGSMIAVDMGPANFLPKDIPFDNSKLQLDDLLFVPFSEIISKTATLVSMGNPHAVYFVPNCEIIELEKIGPLIENHYSFPDRTNVEFVQKLSDGRMRMRVWERGAGITRACGSGACAVAVAGARHGFIDRKVEILLDGGSLWIEIVTDEKGILKKESSGKNRVIMTGPVTKSFSGFYFIVPK